VVAISHGVAGAGARERGAPQSPVFGAAENAPKCLLFMVNCSLLVAAFSLHSPEGDTAVRSYYAAPKGSPSGA
jgi:hypothetical protein